jgi:hypothetical protein
MDPMQTTSVAFHRKHQSSIGRLCHILWTFGNLVI